MVKENDHVILVQAFPPQTDKFGDIITPPKIEYIYTDQTADTSPITSKSFDVRIWSDKTPTPHLYAYFRQFDLLEKMF